jgi:UDP-N-acetylglucosamine--N-acetylmuramyl-(pentapeptide) pyrophosphoryl-undecaprenol N-acetylglucosamine transferase
VIAAGGTAGHVVPALAVAEALRAEGTEVVFIGGSRAEAQLVPDAGMVLHTLTLRGLSRSNPLAAARALALAGAALPRARSLLRRLRPDAVMGGGGYVAGPVGLAALSLRLPLVLTEADSHLGLTNRLLAPFARRVCLAFPLEGREGDRYRVTGRPIPPPAVGRATARARLGLGADETCVLVFGGSLGSRSINLAAVEAFGGTGGAPGGATHGRTGGAPGGATDGRPGGHEGEPGGRASLHVLHICGRRDYELLAARELPEGYELIDYLQLAEFDAALAAADLVVARAGGSVFEIAAHGVPAVLIPYPHAAGDHQSSNARWMAEAGAAVVIADAELSGERLAAEAAALLADRGRLDRMAGAARGLARPGAAAEVAEELALAAGR